MITNRDSRTCIDEIAEGIYRVSTPSTKVPGGFTFNQFLIIDDDPLLFHTGLRQLFPLVHALRSRRVRGTEPILAVAPINSLMPVERLRYISCSRSRLAPSPRQADPCMQAKVVGAVAANRSIMSAAF